MFLRRRGGGRWGGGGRVGGGGEVRLWAVWEGMPACSFAGDDVVSIFSDGVCGCIDRVRYHTEVF